MRPGKAPKPVEMSMLGTLAHGAFAESWRRIRANSLLSRAQHAHCRRTASALSIGSTSREHLEALRWPDAVSCPHCGSLDGITKMQGKTARPGLFNCNACRKPFS